MTSLTDSRFHMWRAIFAMAHADGHISDEERRFMQIYLSRLPVSPEQKSVLTDDIQTRHEVSVMFSKVTAEKDIEDFFNFARLLVWCDGNFDEQERQIMALLSQRQDTALGVDRLLLKLQSTGSKKADWLRSARRKVSGLKDILELIPGVRDADAKTTGRSAGVSESTFYMWRAVFAMAHADDVVTAEEKKYLHGILANEPFCAEQKRILEKDIDTPQDVANMFVKVEDQHDRSQFFYHARMLVWSDGDFGEQEQKIIMRLKQTHVRTVDFDQIIKDLDLSLDEEQKVRIAEDRHRVLQTEHPEGFFRKLMRKVSGH